MGATTAHGDGAWPPLDPGGRPVPGEVLVVAVDLERMDEDLALLDQHERRRAACFHDPLVRRRYVAAHHALRLLLGWRLGIEPATLVITNDAHGRPSLRDHPLVFNLSHSGDWGLIALADEGMIGVDLELGERLHDLDRLAARLFDAEALAAFRALPQDGKASAFLTTWVRKEAALKALGLGLPGGMEHVLIAEDPLRLRGDHTRLPGLADLHLHDLPRVGGGAAALCQGPHRRAPTCRAWPVGTTAAGSRRLPSEPFS